RDEQLVVTDVDLDRLRGDRLRTTTFAEYGLYSGTARPFRRIEFALDPVPADAPLTRFVDAHPFVPQQAETLRERCEEIFHTQVAGLAKRLEHVGTVPITIGVSGGLDSTLALLVACKTF